MRSVEQMLAALAPELRAEEFVFCCAPESHTLNIAALKPIATFNEREGLTLVLERNAAATAGFPTEAIFRCITLGLNSDLEEIGLTAAVATALAQNNISANVIAAYHHDHVFVPAARADEALEVLRGLSN